ncbi:tRNA-dihydrouridine synthase C [Pyrenophora tritici-repentis]|nr:tRNA-dihydrouridine synthase C [Pyrenophora tritici-repentis]KAI1579123.1 tRNA-dihydrouridine synthase [Pyrenophora tritici-repentis]PWO20832.1 IleS, Isoleucyl-tRNA synthetase [Pyrenophora tritici-repentis]
MMATETTLAERGESVGVIESHGVAQENGKRRKLHGRAFYESIGSPKLVLAPMVEQSEFAWRLLSRSFLPESQQKNLLAYTPMFHSKMFGEKSNYRDAHFQPLKSTVPSPIDDYHLSQLRDSDRHLDGNPVFDRPLTVQFCSNDPDDFLRAAKHVAPFCDAVDLNLGCPQGIAKRGKYGAFLQEDWDLISRMIRKLHEELDVPVTAKMRVLETPEKTLAYAKTLLDAGASIITVHGRRREQKGHNTGLADWKMIRHLRENLPKETVIFANGNILQHEDIAKCLEATGADGVMSAEGNLYDPTIFAPPPPPGQEGREYWRGRDGKGGYRMDAVMRRYMDIIHRYALGQEPPSRKPLWMPGDIEEPASQTHGKPEDAEDDDEGPPKKKRKQMSKSEKKKEASNPNLTAMQAHLFHLLRPLVAEHHNVRDALARSRTADIDAFENVLTLVEKAVKEGIQKYEFEHADVTPSVSEPEEPPTEPLDPYESSLATVARVKRPYWVCQPYVRPLPKEAIEKGSMTMSKKEKKRLGLEAEQKAKKSEGEVEDVGLVPGGRVEERVARDGEVVEEPRDGVVCGPEEGECYDDETRTTMDRAADYATMFDTLFPRLAAEEGFRRLCISARTGRLRRIRASIPGSFVGMTIFDREAGFQTDEIRLEDIAYELANGLAIAYWADATYSGDGCREGVIGAGVVGVSGAFRYSLAKNGGRYTSGSNDAELFAISLALDHAKNQVQKGAQFRLVRIYTDAQGILDGLNCYTPLKRTLGPLIPGEMTALEVLFEHTQWLDRLGISTKLIWVKGHGKSNGNQAADALAALAVSKHTDLQKELYGGMIPERKIMTAADAPAAFKRRGDDWVKEWVYRANFGLDLITGLDSNQIANLKLSMMRKPPVPGNEKPTPEKPQRPLETPGPLQHASEPLHQPARAIGHRVTFKKLPERERWNIGVIARVLLGYMS